MRRHWRGLVRSLDPAVAARLALAAAKAAKLFASENPELLEAGHAL